MARLFFVQHNRALSCGIARGGFHHALEHQHISRAMAIGHHGEFCAQIHNLNRGIGNAKADRLLWHGCLEGPTAQRGIPCGIQIERRRPFQDHNRAGVERDFGETPRQFKPLAFAQVIVRPQCRAVLNPMALPGTGQSSHKFLRLDLGGRRIVPAAD